MDCETIYIVFIHLVVVVFSMGALGYMLIVIFFFE